MPTKYKFMQSMAPNVMKRLDIFAKERGITLQELIRAKIVPEWEAWMANGGKHLIAKAYMRGYQAHKRKVERERKQE